MNALNNIKFQRNFRQDSHPVLSKGRATAHGGRSTWSWSTFSF